MSETSTPMPGTPRLAAGFDADLERLDQTGTEDHDGIGAQLSGIAETIRTNHRKENDR